MVAETLKNFVVVHDGFDVDNVHLRGHLAYKLSEEHGDDALDENGDGDELVEVLMSLQNLNPVQIAPLVLDESYVVCEYKAWFLWLEAEEAVEDGGLEIAAGVPSSNPGRNWKS